MSKADEEIAHEVLYRSMKKLEHAVSLWVESITPNMAFMRTIQMVQKLRCELDATLHGVVVSNPLRL